MKHEARARVAAVVAAAAKRSSISSVYDYAKSTHRKTSADVRSGQITGYDYDTSSHFSGGSVNSLDFYDYETSTHVQLKLTGNQFSGYDYHTSQHFSGTINGGSISFYDYQTSQHYNFSA